MKNFCFFLIVDCIRNLSVTIYMLYMYYKIEVKIVGIKNFELIAQCISFRNELFIVNFTENIDC